MSRRFPAGITPTLLLLGLGTGCYHQYLAVAHPDPEPVAHQKNVTSYLWGLVHTKDSVAVCDRTNARDQVELKANVGQALLSVVTRAFVVPAPPSGTALAPERGAATSGSCRENPDMPAPTPFAELDDLRKTIWQPKHLTFEQTVTGVDQLFNPSGGADAARYVATTGNIQRLMGEAAAAGVHFRAYGGTWSMSSCAATDGWLLDTSGLNLLFHLRPTSIRTTYGGDRNSLWLAQGGCSIAGLSRRLMPQGKPLQACGASNGQSIAGAIATGTHGSAIRFGGIGEAVRGLHIVVSPTRSIWLEPASDRVTEDGFAAHLGAELVRDDEQFCAALVHFGSLGFIQGVLFQARPLYTLRAWRRRLPYDNAFKAAIASFDPAALPVPLPDSSCPGGDLFHYSLVVDPFHLERGVFVTAMYDQPCGPRLHTAALCGDRGE